MKKLTDKLSSIHFMGIGGSGMAGVAELAHCQGYKITGCDLQSDTPYLHKLRSLGIEIFLGHSPKHIKNAEILAVTPAAFFLNADHPDGIIGFLVINFAKPSSTNFLKMSLRLRGIRELLLLQILYH